MRRLTWLLVLLTVNETAWADESSTVSFELRNGFLIIVSGSIGEMKDLSFIVDTGARRSVVERTIADELGGRINPALALLPSGTVETSRAEIMELNVGPISVAKLSVLAMDLTEVSRMARTRVAGILGMDVLRTQSFTVDYGRKKLHFGAFHRRCRAVPFDPESKSLVTITVNVDGHAMRLLADTGADQLALFFGRLPVELLQSRMLPASGTDLGGELKAAAFLRGADVRVGDRRLRDALVFVLPGGTEVKEYDGNLGLRALGATQVHFDFEHENLCWE